jgi:nucleotide sugar dehydrogenase
MSLRITVVGLGKIGLPLAVQYARKGHLVLGADIDDRVVSLVNAGIEPFPGEALLHEFLPEVVSAGLLKATLNVSAAVSGSDAVVIVVPLFIDDHAAPDFRAMETATIAVASGLQTGTLVSYETTLPVGTTRNRLVPLLEAGSGLLAGRDFSVVFSPERVLTGRVFADLRRYPKLVGGFNEDSESQGVKFYESVLDFDDRIDLYRPNGVWLMGSLEAAELAKLAETTYRDVNIGLANQFALFAEKNGLDIEQVIEACNSQPYSNIHSPGIAVGGHCIPVYPWLYLWNDPAASVVRAAREANAAMPEAAASRLAESMGDLSGVRVAVLGAAYRGGVKETAFSGVFATVDALQRRGADVVVHDQLYSDDELMELGFRPHHRGDPADVLVLQADHDEYRGWSTRDAPGVKVILDGRGIIDQTRWLDDVLILKIGKSANPLH